MQTFTKGIGHQLRNKTKFYIHSWGYERKSPLPHSPLLHSQGIVRIVKKRKSASLQIENQDHKNWDIKIKGLKYK